jgi:hypothetical protein
MGQRWPLRMRIAFVVSPVIGAVVIFLAVLNFELGPKTVPSGGSAVPGLVALVIVGASLLAFGVLRLAYMRRGEAESI